MLSDATPIHYASALAIAGAIKSRSLRSVDVTRHFLDRIARAPELAAYSVVFEEQAMAQAAAADRLQDEGGALSVLHGVPVAVKDSIAVEGTPILAGSLTRAGCVSERSSTAVQRLTQAGMVILGKTNMTEYAFGLSGQNPTVGTARNPWDVQVARAPGGSSSGSGVCVAAGLAPIALGGDTGGSVRAPALMNGLVGYKPSSGVVGRGGCVPLSDTLDVLGPISRTVEDAHALTTLLAGLDPLDPDTDAAVLPSRSDWQSPLGEGDVTLLVLDEASWPGDVAPEVRENWNEALARLDQAGLRLQAWRPPAAFQFKAMSHDNSLVLGYEGFQYYGALAQDARTPMWEVVRQRILRGGTVSRADYDAALQRRRQAMAAFAAMIKPGAAVLMPGCQAGARPLDAADDAHAHLGDWLRAGNFLGAPAVTLPSGFDGQSMPIGLQLLMPAARDLALLAAARRFARVLGPLRRHADVQSWGL